MSTKTATTKTATIAKTISPATTRAPAPTSAARAPSPSPSPAPAGALAASPKKAAKKKEAAHPIVISFRKLSPEGQKEFRERFKAKDENVEVEDLMAEIDELDPEEREAVRKVLDKKASQKPKKLEGQPSQGRSGYNIFMAEALPEVKKNAPNMEHGDAMKSVGVIWKKMTKEEQAPYEELSKQEKAVQAPLLAAFKAQHPEHFDAETGKRIRAKKSKTENQEGDEGEEVDSPNGKKKRNVKPKDPNAPKKNQNAYFFFEQYARKKNLFSEGPKKEFKTRCGNHWKEMSDDKKAPFKKLEAEAKKLFLEQKAAYAAQLASGEPIEVASETGKRLRVNAKANDSAPPQKSAKKRAKVEPTEVEEDEESSSSVSSSSASDEE